MTNSTEKLNAIEQSLSHQERFIEVLNDVVYQQGRQLDAYAQMVKRLDSRVKQLEHGTNAGDASSTAEEASPWKDPEM